MQRALKRAQDHEIGHYINEPKARKMHHHIEVYDIVAMSSKAPKTTHIVQKSNLPNLIYTMKIPLPCYMLLF